MGQAQGVFETVLKYTGERIVADKPIRQHSIATGMLADMAIGIQTARCPIWRLAHMYDHPETYGAPMSNFMLSRASAAKVYACDMAVNGYQQGHGTDGGFRICQGLRCGKILAGL